MEISVEEALRGDYLFVDLRSEKEYGESHIPFATSVPLLDDDARETVGTLYRKAGREVAIRQGLEYVGPLLAPLVAELKELAKEKEIVLYCSRGGMRSKSMYTLLDSLGVAGVHRLQGGYKDYRRYVLETMPKLIEEKLFVVFQGLTGVGKTKILEELTKDYFVLNLEELAKHRGSVFGDLGQEHQPSQKAYENMIFHQLLHGPKLVLVEAESTRIGKLTLPRELKEKMRISPLILLEASLGERTDLLYEIYVEQFRDGEEEILADLWKLKRQLGRAFCEDLEYKIRNDHIKEAIASLLENYYDPLYMHSIKKTKDKNVMLRLSSHSADAIEEIKRSLHDLLHS